MSAISAVLDSFPHAGLSVAPTPLHRLPRLTRELGHEIYVLREDLTGFGLGGNKVRKLDYLIGDALAKGADVLVTQAASSFSRNAAAAAKVYGLDLHVVLGGSEAAHNRASRALFEQFGTTLHYVEQGGQGAVATAHDHLVASLRAQGRHVYVLHPGGSDVVGSLGYLRVFDEIVRFSQAAGLRFQTIILPTGSTATQVGLVLGQAISGYETRVVGMAISQGAEVQQRRVLELAVAAADVLGVDLDEDMLVVDDRFLGDGYAIPSEAGQQAVRMFAHLEGVLLDDVYAGKAAAGLVHYARSGAFVGEDPVLFLHTGGNAGLFY